MATESPTIGEETTRKKDGNIKTLGKGKEEMMSRQAIITNMKNIERTGIMIISKKNEKGREKRGTWKGKINKMENQRGAKLTTHERGMMEDGETKT